jgi:alkyl hydroperoxide reductase subunit AhpF
MDELLQPDKAFQKQTTGVFIQIGLRSQSRWLKKAMETEQWETASLAFSYSL